MANPYYTKAEIDALLDNLPTGGGESLIQLIPIIYSTLATLYDASPQDVVDGLIIAAPIESWRQGYTFYKAPNGEYPAGFLRAVVTHENSDSQLFTLDIQFIGYNSSTSEKEYVVMNIAVNKNNGAVIRGEVNRTHVTSSTLV